MDSLPAAFAPLATVPQWVLYTTTPRKNQPGKFDKLPVDPRTGEVANAQDPAVWADYETAAAAARHYKLKLGFVFTRDCGLWCMDLDGCLLPNGLEWSPAVQLMKGWLPGVAIEVSNSGKGMHFIGSGPVPPHRSKPPAEIAAAINAQYPGVSVEFYHENRFIALTGDRVGGDARVQPPLLADFLAAYFPPGAAGGTTDDLVDEARSDWSGIADDDELLAAALTAAPSASASFGNDVTMRDLWERNVDALGRKWPDNGREFNESDADMSLAQRLAFWTGCNGARMERLMRRSALVRDKWDTNASYLARTINLACSRQDRVHQRPSAPGSGTQAPVMAATPQMVTGLQYLPPTAQVEYFAGCVYVQDLHQIYSPRGTFLKTEQFRATYGGYIFALDAIGEKTTKDAYEAFTSSQAVRFPKVEGAIFRPEIAPGAIIQEDGRDLVNTYYPVETPAIDGNPQPFLDFLAKLLPDARDRQILLTYLAACVQHKGRKFQWWPVLQGVEGNGKTLIVSAMTHALGARYTFAPNVEEIAKSGNKFNGWVRNMLFVAMEEIYVEHRRDFLNAFKTTVTNERLPVERKGIDQIMCDNRANGIMCTNWRAGVPVTVDQRRYAVFYTAQQSREDMDRDGMGGSYFAKLYDWCKGLNAWTEYGPGYGFAVINYYLQRYALVAEFNPAGDCQIAPKTSTAAEAIEESRGGVEQEILEAIGEGRTGFCGGWISSTYLDRMLKSMKTDRQITHKRRRDMLLSLGYEWHPGLIDGRVDNPVAPDGARSRLYIKRGHIHANLTQRSEIARYYSEAQGAAAALSAGQVFGSN